jgi:PAS domain S-box-containing protein
MANTRDPQPDDLVTTEESLTMNGDDRQSAGLSNGCTVPGLKPTYEELLARVAQLEQQQVAFLLEHAAGQPLRQYGVMLDITERKRTEEVLRRYELLAGHSRDIVLFMRSEDGRILEANAAAQNAYGYSREEMLSLSIRDLRSHDTTSLTQEQMAVADSGGILFETVHRRKNGSTFPVEVSSRGATMDGTRTLISIVRDITERKKAEEAFKTSELRFRLALRNAPVSVAAQDRELRYIWAFNQRTAPPEEIIGKLDCDIFTAEEAERLTRIKRRVLDEGIELREQMWLDRPSGRIFLDICWEPLRDAAGRVTGVASATVDLTPTKLAEEELRENEATLRGILNAAKESIWLFATNGVTLLGNETALARWGRPAAAIIGRPIEEILPKELARTRLARLQQAATSGPVEFEDCRDGIQFEHRFYPVRGANGEVDRVVGFSRDVTERKIHERRVQQLSRLYAVLSKVNESIVRVRDPSELYREVCRIVAEDGDRPLVWIGLVEGQTVKPVASCGLASAYLEGLRVDVEGEYARGPSGTCIREGRTVVNDDFDSNAATRPWREKALRHGLRASASFPLRHQGAVIGSLTLYGREPGTFDAEQVGLLESLSADVSYALDKMGQEMALRESERSLREADQRKNEFLGVLSHELRNPLTPIRNSLYILDRATPGGEQARRAHSVIDRQVGHLSRLVDDLLDVTRITRGKIRLQRTRVDFVDLVRRTVEDHRSLLEEHEVAIDLPSKAIWIDGDPTRVAQVLGNLIGNASKFTPEDGKVSVSLTQADGYAVLEVADTGMGIDAETLKRLFEPFAQADRSLDRSRGGLGLGLALVKGMVELHGGEVSAHSDGPGKGARFTIKLPIDHGRTTAGDAPQPKKAAGDGRTILIIEDNKDAADSLSEALELSGHQVTVAYDGETGLAKAREVQPEIVLCDIGLPRMDGYSVARALRQEAATASAYLVALTGYAQPEDQRRVLGAGFDAHLGKPPDLAALALLLTQAPRRRALDAVAPS